MRTQILCAVAALTVTGCAPVQRGPDQDGSVSRVAAGPRQCFDIERVTSFRAGDGDRLYVRTRPGDVVYQLSGVGCRDLDFAIRLGLAPDGWSGRQVCVGDPVRVVNPSAPLGQTTCRVRIDRALSPTEVAALPGAQRP